MGRIVLALFAILVGWLLVLFSRGGPDDVPPLWWALDIVFLVLLVVWLRRRGVSVTPVAALPIIHIANKTRFAIDWLWFLHKERRKEKIREFIDAANRDKPPHG